MEVVVPEQMVMEEMEVVLVLADKEVVDVMVVQQEQFFQKEHYQQSDFSQVDRYMVV